MEWDEFNSRSFEQNEFPDKVKMDINCPNCGEKIWKRIDFVVTVHPPKYQYECSKCGWTGVGI